MATRDELRKEAKELGIPRYSRMRKDELQTAVRLAKYDRLNELTAKKRFDVNAVHEIGKGSLANAAIYLSALIAANDGKKGSSREFRKLLRNAGYNQHAGVDIRRIDEYKQQARVAA